MDPNLQELLAAGTDGEIEAIIRLAASAPPPPQVRIVARFGDIATCRLARASIAETWADESVVSLKSALPFAAVDDEDLEVDETVPAPGFWSGGDIHRPAGLEATGRGVIVAVIDWGFDLGHDNFRNEDGSTRVLALWDQTAVGGQPPEPYGYGRIFTREEIDRALASARPYEALGYHPGKSDPRGRGTHGTHVLDIAAGNGRLAGSLCGVAPEADLLLVHPSSRSAPEPANLGDSVTLLEALDWIRSQAGDRPFVCNMSVGRHGGPHTGLTLVEQCMDYLLTEAPGRCIVQSAGNYYRANVHSSGQLRPGESRTIRWRIASEDRTGNELEIWYSRRDALVVSLAPPGGERTVSVRLGGRASIRAGGREVGRLYHRASDPSNGDHHIDIFLDEGAPSGDWQVTIEGCDIVDGRYHAWAERDSACMGCQSRLHPDDADPRTTTGTICNGQRTIAVGAYDANDPDWALGRFSSSGPTADGRHKPDLVAPGVRVWAAKSTPRDSAVPDAGLAVNSGTSMAAPHVTGCIANLFQAVQRPLSIEETRFLLLNSARLPGDLDEETRWRIGSGYLDMLAVEEAAHSWDRTEESLPSGQSGSARGGSAWDCGCGCPARSRGHAAATLEILDEEDGSVEMLLIPPSFRGGQGHILWIQRALNRLFGWTLKEDGIAGPLTLAAIREFQRTRGLTVDGVVGRETEGALVAAMLGLQKQPELRVCAGVAYPEILQRFGHGEARVLPAHQLQLMTVAKCIVDRHGGPGQVSAVHMLGHTDASGEAGFNIDLGFRRAHAVAAALRDRLRDRAPHLNLHLESVLPITTESRGEGEPGFATDAQNRRVEIFIPELEDKRSSPKVEPNPDTADQRRQRMIRSVTRSIAVLAAQEFPDEQRKRLTCLMGAALNEAVVNDDLYINGKDFNVRLLAQGIGPRMSPQDFVKFVANGRVRRDLSDPLFEGGDESDLYVKGSLQALDERILAGINLIQDQTQRNSELNVVNPILRQMQQFVSAEQRNPRSIYFCYGLGQQ